MSIEKKLLRSFFTILLMHSALMHGMEEQCDPYKTLSRINDTSLTTLYTWRGKATLLYLSPEYFDAKQEDVNLKELFANHQLIPDGNVFYLVDKPEPWSEEDWQKATETLIKRSQGQEDFLPRLYQPKISLDALPQLLYDAKSILKSFLPSEQFIVDEQKFIKKYNAIDRLLTYAKLQHDIQEKQLPHVSLPRKLLVIQDKKSEEYLDSQRAQTILDDALKIAVLSTSTLAIKVHWYSEQYALWVFAERKIRHSTPLSHAAFENLKKLVSDAPFDVGYDNIFSDEQGNAIIIDTEFKGEPAETSIPKLNRYRHTTH